MYSSSPMCPTGNIRTWPVPVACSNLVYTTCSPLFCVYCFAVIAVSIMSFRNPRQPYQPQGPAIAKERHVIGNFKVGFSFQAAIQPHEKTGNSAHLDETINVLQSMQYFGLEKKKKPWLNCAMPSSVWLTVGKASRLAEGSSSIWATPPRHSSSFGGF